MTFVAPEQCSICHSVLVVAPVELFCGELQKVVQYGICRDCARTITAAHARLAVYSKGPK